MTERKTILLVNINVPDLICIPPLGLLYVGSELKKAGYQVKVLHISTAQVDDYIQVVLNKNPLYVGFSVFTGTAMRAYAKMCRRIKEQSNIPIVWGNIHPSSLPEQCLEETYIDYVVIGEGEVTAVELAQALEGHRELKDVMGIGYKQNGEIIITKPRPFIKNLDDYAMDWSLVDVGLYISSGRLPVSIPGKDVRTLHFVTSRGCPHRCGFCYNKKYHNRRMRKHSIDFVVSQINRLKEEYSFDSAMFWDDEFFADKERAFAIVEQIGLPYCAHCRIDYIDDNFARRLAETGCRYLLIGFESGSDRILEMITKDITVSDIKAGVRALANYPSLQVSGSMIFGFPTETPDEFRSSLKLITELLEIKSNISFTTGWYIPYPGSELYDFVLQHGFRPPRRTEDWEDMDRWVDKFEITWIDWLSSTQATKIRRNILFLAALYRHDIPLIKRITKRQFLARDGQLGIVLGGLSSLYKRITVEQNNIFSLLGNFILRAIWKIKSVN